MVNAIYRSVQSCIAHPIQTMEKGLRLYHRHVNPYRVSSVSAIAASLSTNSLAMASMAITFPLAATYWTQDMAFRSAIREEDMGTIRAMISNGYKPKPEDTFNVFRDGKTSIALFLIQKLSVKELSMQYRNGETLLHVAIRKGPTDLALALIERLPPEMLNVQDNDRKTPLHSTIVLLRCTQPQVALALIEKLPAVMLNVQDNDRNTPLLLAILLGLTQPQFALALIEKLPAELLNVQDNDRNTPLHAAIMLGRTQIALALIDKLPRELLHVRNNRGETPLDLAIEYSCTNTALVLTEKLYPEMLNNEASPLYWAFRANMIL